MLSACGPLDRAELKRQVLALGSLAAEGELIAHDVEYGRTKTTFVRAHGGELSSAAENDAQKLSDATPASGYERRTEEAIGIANDISSAIDELRVYPHDLKRARDARAKLQQAIRDVNDLQGRL